MTPHAALDSFYERLKTAVVDGATRAQWSRLVRWLRGTQHGALQLGPLATTAGRLVLRAWQRERRVSGARATALAAAAAATPLHDDDGLSVLQCWRGHDPGPAVAAAGAPERLATCRTTLDILRHHLEDDPAGVVARPETLQALVRRYQVADETSQTLEMALWRRALGKRTSSPEVCGRLPHPERFDLVWAFPWEAPYQAQTADELRDTLGLVSFSFGKGAQLIAFHYPSEIAGELAVPTVVDGLGAWAFVPAAPGEIQRTYNYRAREPGAPEFVHGALVPPTACRFMWVGTTTRDPNE